MWTERRPRAVSHDRPRLSIVDERCRMDAGGAILPFARGDRSSRTPARQRHAPPNAADRRRAVLRSAQRRDVAGASPGFSALADGLLLVPALRPRRAVRAPERSP